MKNLEDFIKESLEIEEIKTAYRNYLVVTLVKRDVDLSSITKEDFIKFMKEDFQTALKEYTKVTDKANINRRANYIADEIRAAQKFAEKKWKTLAKQEKYVANMKKNAEEKEIYMHSPDQIFFDLKPDKGQMGIRSGCVISKDSNDASLGEAYENVKNSKFFNKGTGWAFKYETSNKDNPLYDFRPYIDITLDETTREEQKREEEHLAQAVSDFYKNSNYWGD